MESDDPLGELVKLTEVPQGERFTFEDRDVDLDLVEPEGMTSRPRPQMSPVMPAEARAPTPNGRRADGWNPAPSTRPIGRALLVCSPGGHLRELLALESSWRDFATAWVTLHGTDVDRLLAGRRVTFGHGPTNRSVVALLRNLPLAWRVLRRERPDVVLSTGAGLALPFFLMARAMGVRTIYVESFTRIRSLSLTGRLVYPFASAFFVQWPDAARCRPRAVYVGSIL